MGDAITHLLKMYFQIWVNCYCKLCSICSICRNELYFDPFLEKNGMVLEIFFSSANDVRACSDRRARAHVRGVDAAVLHALLPLRLQPRQQAALRGHPHVLRLRLRPLHPRVPRLPHLHRREPRQLRPRRRYDVLCTTTTTPARWSSIVHLVSSWEDD
jgi:hypothetical protein